MRASPLLVLGLCAASTACDPVLLDTLLAELTITPERTTHTAWIGYPSAVPFVLANGSRVGLDLEAPVLQGAPPQLGAAILNAPARIESAQTAALELALTPSPGSAGLQVELSLTVTPVDDEVAPVGATLSVAVRAPPPCAPRDPCETAFFDPVLGECVRGARPDNESCSDGSLCTEEDRCSSGTCVGRAVTCADSIECTLDGCEPDRGCVFEPIHSRCADDNPCTTDTCVASQGCTRAVVTDGTPCGPFSCDQLETCIWGACVAMPTPDGFPCEDGDLCTAGDSCRAQECVSGEAVEPTAQEPSLIARPTIRVERDVRWFQYEYLLPPGPAPEAPADPPPDPPSDPEGGAPQPPPPLELPEAFDTTLRFGQALDLAQGLVGYRPTLAVLWKSEPFGLNGAHCAPWDLWAWSRASDDPAFCATALVATILDEGELARGEGGTSVLLGIAYGTVDASFSRSADDALDDGPLGDALEVVMIESTYFPYPDPGREVFIDRLGISLATRAITSQDTVAYYNSPYWEVERNVHAGIRIAEQDGVPALVGWDLPRWPDYPDTDGTRDAEEPDAGAAMMPWLEATLERGVLTDPASPDDFGQLAWTPVLFLQCMEVPALTEELAFRDVDVFHHQSGAWAVVRHGSYADAVGGCGEYAEPTSASLIPLHSLDVDTDELPWVALGDDVLSISVAPHGGALAMVRPFFCIDTLADCPSFALQVSAPPLGAIDPTVTAWSASLGDYTTAKVSALALEPRFGAIGAVVIERDALGSARVKLLDHLDTAQQLTLATAPFAIAERGARALRSPLSPQSVYAVVTQSMVVGDIAETDYDPDPEGAVVRFGCPFPSFPSIVTP